MLSYFVRNLLFIGLVANLSAKFTSQAKCLIAVCRTLRLAIFAVVMLDLWHGMTSGSVLVMRFSSKTKYEFISGGKVFLDKGFFLSLRGTFCLLARTLTLQPVCWYFSSIVHNIADKVPRKNNMRLTKNDGLLGTLSQEANICLHFCCFL